MTEKAEKKPSKLPVVIFVLAFILVFLIFLTVSDAKFAKKEAAFREKVVDTLKMYSAIEKYDLKRYEINLYIKPSTWEKASPETQKAFLSEVYVMIRMDGITSGYLDETAVMLNYYVGNDFLTCYNVVK